MKKGIELLTEVSTKTIKKLQWCAFIVFIVANIFGLFETAYFGFNIFPESHAEAICDTITASMCAFAMGIWFVLRIIKE